jgi:hypothetical protein
VFWVHYSENKPTPRGYFLLDSTEAPELVEWHKKASELEARIERVMKIRTRLFNDSTVKRLVAKHTWYSQEVTDHVSKRLGKDFADDMEIITDYMAQAALTGEPTLRSWIDWKAVREA